jgi:hypothetical protein
MNPEPGKACSIRRFRSGSWEHYHAREILDQASINESRT